MRRLIWVLILCMVWGMAAHAETAPYTQAWSVQLGGMGTDVLTAYVERMEGGLFLVGSATSEAEDALGGTDAWALCLDEAGETLWSRRMGGKGEDRFTQVAALEDGGIIILGTSTSEDGALASIRHGRTEQIAWVLRLDGAGEIVWEKALGGLQDDELLDMHLEPDSIVFAGRSQSYKIDLNSNAGGWDAWACAIELETGASLWHYRYGNAGDDVFEHILPDDDGWMFLGTHMLQSQEDPGVWEERPILVALNQEGGEYGSYPVVDVVSTKIAFARRVDEGWILAGQTAISGGEAWIGQLSGDGSLLWNAWFSGNVGSRAIAMYPFSDVSIMLGVTSSLGDGVVGTHGGQDIWIVARSENEPMLWQQALGGSGDSWPIGLTRLLDDSYLIAGVTTSADGDLPVHDAQRAGWLVQLGSNGNVLWSALLAPTDNQVLVDMIMDPEESLYLLGEIHGRDGINAWVVKMVSAQ